MATRRALQGDNAERSPELLHFRAFEAIFRLGSLTAAAEHLGLTQPALSKSLSLLRRYYGEDLFIRGKQGMRPTARARLLAPHVVDMLRIADGELRAQAGFEPARSSRVFRISCSEIGAIHFMPRLVASAAALAPGVRFDVVPLLSQQTESMLANGEVDLALGAYMDFGSRVHSQALYEVPYVCLVRQGHPRIGQTMDLAAFRREQHVVASLRDTMHAFSRVEQAIIDVAGSAAITLRVHSLLVAPYVVAQTDHIFTATQHVAQRVAVIPGLRVVECPLPLPSIVVRQYWHSSQSGDPAIAWLRAQIESLFGEDLR
ncbi:LysR family transcriptional regulator [Paucibacter sp. JuS9]|uniref:LysR family transcriptional regulator n=1 Tax=Roseateles TaxID=93681 RepID=UPI002FE59446